MAKEHDGREVAAFNPDQTNEPCSVRAPKEGERFIFLREYHGEYDLEWIAVERDGAEVERFNVKLLPWILWAPVADQERYRYGLGAVASGERS